MASRNADAVSNQGEFHPSKPRDEPVTTSGVSNVTTKFKGQLKLHQTSI